MPQNTVTLIVAGLGIGGTLGGVVVGHFLTRSWQREQWILDNRKEEYRELLSTLTMTYALMVQRNCTTEAAARAHAVISDRLYIAVEVEELRVAERWKKIIAFTYNPSFLKAMEGPFCDLTTDIVAEALKRPRSRLKHRIKGLWS